MKLTYIELKNILKLVPSQDVTFDYDYDYKGRAVGRFEDNNYVIPILDYYIDLKVFIQEVYYRNTKHVETDIDFLYLWKNDEELEVTDKQVEIIKKELSKIFNLS